MAEKLPPANREYESWVIGELVQSGDLRRDTLSPTDAGLLAATGITREDFHDDRARATWDACARIVARGENPTLVTLRASLPEHLHPYLEECIRVAPGPGLAIAAARELHRLAYCRSLILAGGAIARIAYEPGELTREQIYSRCAQVLDNLDPGPAKAETPRNTLYRGLDID